MSFLSLSGVFLIFGLACASQPHMDSGDAPLGPETFNHSSPSPWKFKPECVTAGGTASSICVYTSHAFADGRGISILTTPERAEYFERLPAFAEPGVLSDRNTQPSQPPFEEKELPGRGRGLVANKTLYRGDRIFAHNPVLILDEDTYRTLDDKKSAELENKAVNQLPPGSKKMFWDLYGQPLTDPASDRINTNSFELDIETMTHFGVIPEISRLNHDCRPNAAYFFDAQTLTRYVHAITTISPGTEITITYIDPHQLRQQRVTNLYSSWGFNCSCSLCSLHPSLGDASDTRLIQMDALAEVLEESPITSPQIAQMLISLYEQERLHAPLSNAYRVAALSSCAHGQRWNTIRYAYLAVEHLMLDEGFRNEEVRLMELLADQPESQSCWLQRVKKTEN